LASLKTDQNITADTDQELDAGAVGLLAAAEQIKDNANEFLSAEVVAEYENDAVLV